MLGLIVLMLYAFGVPVDMLTLTLMVEQIFLAMEGGNKMSKNSLRAGIVCACGVAETVSLKTIVHGRAWRFESSALRLFRIT